MALKTITFTCETITPMFLSGADGQTPELRPPSIKGALRFWWRAMNGHLSLEELKKQEAMIFGDTSNRSKIIIRNNVYKLETSSQDFGARDVMAKSKGKTFPILEYLSFGTFKDGRKVLRDYIKPKQKFTVILQLSNEEKLQEIIDAFLCILG
ncbi:MAG: type III-B CRISPR module RAMP protein Cmr1 [Flexibacter sp. CG_4_10_14_3_um_filter_32_15]|nr:MAG: type III-B CRISPR module RAMP protein Cmr1 [Flexibacter sp. CG_4_10_14_3_um_filter_32_15]